MYEPTFYCNSILRTETEVCIVVFWAVVPCCLVGVYLGTIHPEEHAVLIFRVEVSRVVMLISYRRAISISGL